MPPPGRVLVIVPAFNEGATVADVVTQVRAAGYPALVVDDGSSDWTGLRASDAGAVVLRLPVNVGVGGALRCGFRYATTHRFEIAVQCDADGQHCPAEIVRLLAAVDDGAHLVIGSRFAERGAFQASATRRIGMRLVTALARRQSGVHLTDATSGFRAVAQPLLDDFAASYPNQYLGDTVEAVVAAARSGYRIVEVPVNMNQRALGQSNASSLAAIWYVTRVITAVALRGGRRPSSRSPQIPVRHSNPVSS